MALEGGKVYDFVIRNPRLGASSTKGTPSLSFTLESPEGKVFHDEWITAGRRTQIVKNLVAIGLTEEEASSKDFWKNVRVLEGRKVNATLEVDATSTKGRLRVKWFNGPKKASVPKPDADNALSKIADVFGFGESEDEFAS